MIGIWNLPKELIEIEPIDKETTNIFFGREKLISEIKKRISVDSILVLEGKCGIGKTSIGNKIRFEDPKRFTPIREIKCRPTWNNSNFLIEIQSHIIGEIFHKDSKFSTLSSNPFIKTIYNRNSTEEYRHFNTCRNNVTGSKILFSENSIYEEICQIIKLLQSHTGIDEPIILQISNLDMNITFNKEQLKTFLNNIRDSLQIKGIKFLLIGANGLYRTIQQISNLKKIVTSPFIIKPFTLEETICLLNKRIEKSKYKHQALPFERDLLNLIYTHSEKNTKLVLTEIGFLLNAFKWVPLIESISSQDASYFYSSKLKANIEKLIHNETSKQLLSTIKKSPGIMQSEILKNIHLSQGATSLAITKLINKGVIIKKDHSSGYYLTPSYELALNQYS